MKLKLYFLQLFLLLAVLPSWSQTKITISGHITDAKTGETLIGAGVMQGKIGVVTNNYGFYSLTIHNPSPNGVKLTYSYLGYKEVSINLKELRDTTINVKMELAEQLKEATIVAQKDAGIASTKMSAIEIPNIMIKNTPTLFGEPDVLKTIQLMPGVQSGAEGFSGIYVRGGGVDENLLMLDGVQIYNADHVLGLFSVFQPEAVKKVTLYKGAFPARYGGRVSSIIDVRTNDGNLYETHGLFSVGLISDKFHIEGPIWKGRTTYSISLRGMHTFLFTPILKLAKSPANYYFYDFNAKFSHKFSEKDRLFFSYYQGHDVLNIESKDKDEGVSNPPEFEDYGNTKWGNRVAALRWNHIFNNKLFFNFTGAFNRYNMKIYSKDIEKRTYESKEYIDKSIFTYKSGIRDFDFKMDFDYTPNPNHLIKFGASYIRHRYSPEQLNSKSKNQEGKKVIQDTTYKMLNSRVIYGNEYAAYLEDDIRLSSWLTLDPGLRFSAFNTQGKTYYSLEPRIATKISISDFALKAAYSKMTQYVHLLTSTQLSLPFDLWVPITKNIAPESSDQYSVGLYYTGLKGWEFSTEAYYKDINNVMEYRDGTTFIGASTSWQTRVAVGEGRAMGVEFMVEKNIGKTTGWIAYTLSKSDRIFKDGSINNGKRFPFRYDRRHKLNVVVNHKFNKTFDVSATWQFTSGPTMTVAEYAGYILSPYNGIYDSDYVSHKNNFRLPASHSLNLSMNIHRQYSKNREGIFNVSLYNAYNRMNPNFVYRNTVTDDHGNVTDVKMKKITILPILPSFSYTFKF